MVGQLLKISGLAYLSDDQFFDLIEREHLHLLPVDFFGHLQNGLSAGLDKVVVFLG